LKNGQFRQVHPLKTSPEEQTALIAKFSSRHTFDGLLPRLVNWEQQYDETSGRSRIHLTLAACSFSAVILDHYPAQPQVDRAIASIGGGRAVAKGIRKDQDIHGLHVGLMTLSSVPITSDGYLVLVERSSETGIYEGLLGTAISGNLEWHARNGHLVDFDGRGMPDIRRALAREAKEELGITLSPESFAITGLANCDSPVERGTNIVLSLVRLPLTLDKLQKSIIDQSDLVEGRWEIGSRLLGIPIPREKKDEGATIARWLLNTHELTPHATIATLAALMVVQDIPPIEKMLIDGPLDRPSEVGFRELKVW
jgi:hypothetical protein